MKKKPSFGSYFPLAAPLERRRIEQPLTIRFVGASVVNWARMAQMEASDWSRAIT